MPQELRGIEFMSLIWQHQLNLAPDEEYWLTMMKRGADGYMNHKAMPASVLQHRLLFPMPDEGDWYWCPNLFSKPKRRMKHGVGGAALYQDLDEVHPDSCSAPPQWWWETSPARYQAIWLLDQWLPVEDLLRLNKALNRGVKADKGTWNLTRLLRIPGSWSSKRQTHVGPARKFSASGLDAA